MQKNKRCSRRTIKWFIIVRHMVLAALPVFILLTYSKTIYAGDIYKADMKTVLEEYHAVRLKYIENSDDLVHYMYQSFLIGNGRVVAYTGVDEITLENIEDYVQEVIRIDKPALQDCEALWGNIDGYSKAISDTEAYTLICVCPVYRHTQKEIKKLNAVLDHIIDGWSSENGLSREEKTKLVHDYIVNNFDYDSSLENYDDYDGFFNRKNGKRVMVCQGYALLTYKLLNRLDVPCKILLSETHSWNIVQLEDGYWYHLDCTSDDLGIYGKENVYDNFLKPELPGNSYNYLDSCILYDNLEHYEFGTRKYSRTEIKYIIRRIFIKRDFKYFMEKLMLVKIEILLFTLFFLAVFVYIVIMRKIQHKSRKEKISKEDRFTKYNKI